ncbi:protein ALP1-like [Senna tora]|uniref:Protein ALP1-like n=1 Tax=Senna tora TaxID=362788 RepID=A0A835CH64_9FABA|nr:protein ALP1-like [Senna tora]
MFLEIQKICLNFAMHMFWNMKRISSKSYTYDSYAKRARLRALVYASDTTCFNQIRKYRHTFDRLSGMLDIIGGLRPIKNMLMDDQVAIFLHILAHHVKNRVVQFEFERSGETLEPVPEDSTDERWKWFMGCLGAIDGTHIRIRVPLEDQGKYRNRKGEITTNVLEVYSRDGQFVYVWSGWEGSAVDGRGLKDAIERDDGFEDQYYLVDAGFANCKGFLAPYRRQRNHLNIWRQGRHPASPQECFNMRHLSARNDNALDQVENQQVFEDTPIEDVNPITTIEPFDDWSAWCDRLAADMFDELSLWTVIQSPAAQQQARRSIISGQV